MIILTGASASGKTEIAKNLAKKYHIIKAITTTTRSPRVGERDGRDYFFVDQETFLKEIDQDKFVEHTLYNSHYYGTGKSQISLSKCVVVDPNGLKSFMALKNPGIITFYLKASESTRRTRMQIRGDKEDAIVSRLANDRIDFAPQAIPETDFSIVTDEKSIEEITDEVYMKYILLLKERGLEYPTFTSSDADGK